MFLLYFYIQIFFLFPQICKFLQFGLRRFANKKKWLSWGYFILRNAMVRFYFNYKIMNFSQTTDRNIWRICWHKAHCTVGSIKYSGMVLLLVIGWFDNIWKMSEMLIKQNAIWWLWDRKGDLPYAILSSQEKKRKYIGSSPYNSKFWQW